MFTEESGGWRHCGSGGDEDDDEASKRKKFYCTRRS
jgi:hypothetical protein